LKTKTKAAPERRFGKPLYEAGLQCQKRLYLDFHEPAAEPDSETRRTMSETGKTLLQLARGAFARGVEVAGKSLEQRAEKTAELLAQGESAAMFGAAFVADDIEATCDIVVRQKDGSLDLFEVKSGTRVKSRHLGDLALQTLTIEKAGHKVRGAFVLFLDKTYRHAGGNSYAPGGLIKSADVTERVRRLLPRVQQDIERFRLQLRDDSALALPTGSFCASPFPCPHLERCQKQEPEFPLRTLPDLSRAQESELHQEGLADLAQLDPERTGLTVRQRRTLEAIRQGEPILEPFVKEELLQVEFPLHFLSIARVVEPLPRFAGQRPWQPTPYAWAVETVNERGVVTQDSFALADKEDPRPEFIRTLSQRLEAGGMLILWSADSLDAVRTLLDSLPAEKPSVRAAMARPHMDLHRLLESGLFHPDLMRSRTVWDTARVLLGAVPASLGEVRDEDTLLSALQKAATPRTRLATKEKIAADIKAFVAAEAATLLALCRKLSGHPALQQAATDKPARRAAMPRKQLPPT
jgi:hypothetical protein